MINLIPPHAQALVKKEYWLRVLSVWMILLGIACAVVTCFSIPVYVLVQSQLEAFSDEFAQVSVESKSYEESQREIVRANETAVLLASAKPISFRMVISELEALMGEEIVIEDFKLSQKSGVLDPVTITGVATTRLALTTFKERIEAHPLFGEAVLPLSNLARDKDITFSITIQPEVIDE